MVNLSQEVRRLHPIYARTARAMTNMAEGCSANRIKSIKKGGILDDKQSNRIQCCTGNKAVQSR